MDAELLKLAEQLAQTLKRVGLSLTTAESCTGGGLAEVLTTVPGSSIWFERGFVSYSNLAKREMLEVSTETLARHGAVSEPTARAMAEGALTHSPADLAVAITGIAGPGGGTEAKPVGYGVFCLGSSQTCNAQHHLAFSRRSRGGTPAIRGGGNRRFAGIFAGR